MMQAYPYPRPEESLFRWQDWQVWDRDQLVEQWRDSLDSTRVYKCSVVLEIDSQFWQPEDPLSQLLLVIEAYCPSTLLRKVESTEIIQGATQVPLSINVEGWALAKLLELEASVVATRIPATNGSMGEEIKSGRLVSSGISRFAFSPSENILRPTEVSFSATGRRNIPWEIESNFYTESDDFVSNLHLSLNSDMPIVISALEGNTGKPVKWNLTYELMLNAVRTLSEVVLELEGEQLESTANEHPESLCAAVKKYADEAALSMVEILRMERQGSGDLESRLKEVASKIVEL